MRRVYFLVAMALVAGCGDSEDAPGEETPAHKECVPRSPLVTTMAAMEELGASGCSSAYGLTINGPEITSLEPLRALRQVSQLRISGTQIRTLEPLRDLQDVEYDVTFDDNPRLTYCEVTGWIALVKTRNPERNFGFTVDNPKQNDPCATVNYP